MGDTSQAAVQKLTKTLADKVRYPSDGMFLDDAGRSHYRRFAIWDRDLKGFGLRVYPSGRKVFVFRYKIAGRQRWLTIGDYGAFTVQSARRRAEVARGQMADGTDPAEARRQQRERARFLRYAVLLLLVGVFLISPQDGERLAEIEPFKSTFFVAPWTRGFGLFAWWLLLAGASVVWFRPFCRYLCPLGAALALPSSFRLSGPHRREFCSRCNICTRGCEPRAIRKDGSIDPRECLNCWECEANWRDDQVCPPLVKARRDRERKGAA